MALTLSCFILDQGEDALTHWLEVELREGGKTLDGDIFRYAKATKRVLLNPQFDLEGNQIDPAIQVPTAIWEDREGNSFDYDEVMETAARHFLRRQGILAKLEQWSSTSIRFISGTPVTKDDGRTLTARRELMVGAVVEVDDATRTKTLQKLDLHRGTVFTISANYDARVDILGTKTTSDIVFRVRGHPSVDANRRIRAAVRFPLAVIGATDTISNVDFKFRITFSSAPTNEGRIQAYNIDGQADPDADAGSTMYSRAKDDSTPYLSAHSSFDGVGVKTVTIAADANVEAAVDTPDRFSLGLAITSDETAVSDRSYIFEATENTGTDEPKLIVTTLGDPVYEQTSFRFRNDDGTLGELA